MVEAVSDLAVALVKARGEFPAITKNRIGQARGGKYKYADLSSILDAVTKPLLKHGISIVQIPENGETGPKLTTTLLHTSGQRISGTSPLPSNASSQEMGSALTYARRYAICAMLCIAADDDDDGAEAESGHHKQQSAAQAAAPTPKPAKAQEKPKAEAKPKPESKDGLFGGPIAKIEAKEKANGSGTPLKYHLVTSVSGEEFILPPPANGEEQKIAQECLKALNISLLKKSSVVIEYHISPKGAYIMDRVKLEE